jgi:hypothetical protein
MDKRYHWWNGKMGMARRDVFVYEDRAAWRVEARTRGSGGVSHWHEATDEARAVLLAHDLMQDDNQWRDLSELIGAVSPIHQRGRPDA